MAAPKEEKAEEISIASCPIVVCGPSGVGKGTLLRRARDLLPNTFGVAVSHTTRKPRKGEEDGVHYNFTTKEAFQKGIDAGDFVEFADVNGNFYGTSYQAIDDVSAQNLICILEIDVQGADIIKKADKLDARYLFITAQGGVDTLKQRLEGRQTETPQQIKRRLDTATKELAFLDANADFFGRVISNDDLEVSVVTLVQQFKQWYPWIITDRLSAAQPNDDDKKISGSAGLVYEQSGIDALFNALQFDTTLIDVRSADDFKTSHVDGAINLADADSLTKMSESEFKYARVFVYGDGSESSAAQCRRLYVLAQTSLNAVQFCEIDGPFSAFATVYPFLCAGAERVRFPNSVSVSGLPGLSGRLFVGGEAHAFSTAVITKLGITHIVNTKGTQSELDENVKKGVKYLDLYGVDDKVDAAVLQYFDKVTEFVAGALEENKVNRVLVHCGGGKSRSTTFTMAYLMKGKSMTLAEAYGTVSVARPKAFPNDGFLEELSRYECELRGKSSKQFIAKSVLRDKTRWKAVCASWGI